ncbi:hypothetical protein [Nocardia miyunensis]|uniref:hypothetical protein n=1 Tax=Nocardia miyunensis TaxID=282684 RepID=UPI00082B1A07|nr:hypothetical protein [Nocardia miyunensis]
MDQENFALIEPQKRVCDRLIGISELRPGQLVEIEANCSMVTPGRCLIKDVVVTYRRRDGLVGRHIDRRLFGQTFAPLALGSNYNRAGNLADYGWQASSSPVAQPI